MAELTGVQINALKFLDATFGADPVRMRSGRLLADKMRRTLPGVDDVTIAVVLMEVGDFVAGVVHVARDDPEDSAQGEAALTSIAATAACAAVQLTEIHWREETP
jgi:hypothetical protein